MSRTITDIVKHGIVLLLCLWQATGIAVYGQDVPRAASKRHNLTQNDSIRQQRKPRLRPTPGNDSLSLTAGDSLTQTERLTPAEQKTADSLAAENRRKMLELTSGPVVEEQPIASDSLNRALRRRGWVPNPTKATWLALVFPGGGQIYNRKYWKLPIVYGGFAGCAYALTWNNKMYKDYMSAYKDAANNNWNSTSITDLLPPGYLDRVSKTQLTETLRKRKDTYRRYRDLSIFAFIGVYLISVVDAYVDAELSNFDITPDLSMSVEPAVIDTRTGTSSNHRSVGVQCSFRF